MANGGGAMEGQILRAPPWTAAQVRAAVAAVYSRVATSPAETFRFPVGPSLAHQLGYPEDVLQSLPPTAIESFTGVACPVLAAHLASGEWVLDLGSGAGLDALIAARQVGPSGRVVGVDLSAAMVAKAQATAAVTGVVGGAFSRGGAEALPFPGNAFDAVLVNGLLNLTPDKSIVVQEIHRVLRSGGRAVVAEIVTDGTPPPVSMKNLEDWFR